MGCRKILYQQEKVYIDQKHIFFDFEQEKNARLEKNCGYYFPAGMLMPKRFSNANSYRYQAINGMERDNEVKGNNNHLSTFFRQYDPRIARWMSTDPVKFPSESPYVENHNNPIYWKDPMGNCPECDENNSDPQEGDTYTTKKGWEFTYTEEGWTGAGHKLKNVEITPNNTKAPKMDLDKVYADAKADFNPCLLYTSDAADD